MLKFDVVNGMWSVYADDVLVGWILSTPGKYGLEYVIRAEGETLKEVDGLRFKDSQTAAQYLKDKIG